MDQKQISELKFSKKKYCSCLGGQTSDPQTKLNNTFYLISWEGKRYDIKTLSIDRVLKKEHFYWNVMQKMCPEASTRPLFNFVKQPKTHCMQENLLKIRYFERELSKRIKKVNFIFSFEPSLFQWTKLSKTKEAWN